MKKPLMILGILLLVGGGGYLGYQQLAGWHARQMEKALKRERAKHLAGQEKLDREISDLKRELDLFKEPAPPEQRLEEVFGQDAGAILSTGEDSHCADLDRQVREFFTYLDRKYGLDERSQDGGGFSLFLPMIGQISGTLPLVTGEMKDAYSLARNVAHFYRVLGKDRVRLVRDVLRQEHELVEPVGALLFEWGTSGSRCMEGREGGPTLEVLYEYAAFFLNSLAGKSYMMRRDSRVRLLVTYYSTLIIHRANGQMLNRHGIDILPHIEFSISDMRSHRGLVSRMKYLDRLEGLQKKYEQDRDGETL